MQNLLALRERQKTEVKLRDAIAQRKARRLAIDGMNLLTHLRSSADLNVNCQTMHIVSSRDLIRAEDTSLETMAELLLKREKGTLDAVALRAQIAVFKSQRIRTCGHLLKLFVVTLQRPSHTFCVSTDSGERSTGRSCRLTRSCGGPWRT